MDKLFTREQALKIPQKKKVLYHYYDNLDLLPQLNFYEKINTNVHYTYIFHKGHALM